MRRDVRFAVSSCALTLAVLAASPAHAVDAGGAKEQQQRADKIAADGGNLMPPTAHGGELKEQQSDQATEVDPHGGAIPGHSPHAAHGGAADMAEPLQDGTADDPSLPAGTISVHIADATGKPLPRTEVTLGILYNSVAKGESRKRVTAMTDDQGRARFDHLDTGGGVAYRAMVLRDGATFSVPPMQLSEKSGARAMLHVYPVTSDIEQTLVVGQSIVYTEVKDDRIQVQQAFKIYNFGKNAWVPPTDLLIPLPAEFTAFNAQQGMTDVGIDAVPGKGAKLRGTFAPGQHIVEFKWQLPYSGQATVELDIGMIPHMAAARVIAPASRDMVLDVPGFPTPQATADGMGQRALITELQMKREDKPLSAVKVVIRGLPTSGPGRWIATLLAAGGLAFGLVLGARKPATPDRKRERERLLADLEGLERARAAGDVGPKTYERSRRELLDEIARTFADDKDDRRPAKTKTKDGASASRRRPAV